MYETTWNIPFMPQCRGGREKYSKIGHLSGDTGKLGYVRLLPLMLALSGILTPAPVRAAGTFGIDGYVFVGATGGQYVERRFDLQAVASHSDRLETTGLNGSKAEASYLANLATGQFEVYAAAANALLIRVGTRAGLPPEGSPIHTCRTPCISRFRRAPT